HLYAPRGQRPFAPSLKLKLHLVQAMENLSDRQLEIRLMFDIAIKKFIGVPLSFTGLDHSTLGLDRNRMGDTLFHACFHYVLAQAKSYGLWGQEGDTWLIDSFITHAHAQWMGARRLIQKGILQILQQLKRANLPLFQLAMESLQCETWFERLPKGATSEEQALAFHKLVVRAYSLLSWFEHGAAHTLFWQWPDAKRQLRALELQALLYKILQQNARPVPPTDDTPEQGPKYEKIPEKERPKDRVSHAAHPDLRFAVKNKIKHTDKIQVVKSSHSGFIVEIEPIPANEHDGMRAGKLIQQVIDHHETHPEIVGADSAYGYGAYRAQLVGAPYKLVTPIVPPTNPSGLLGKEQFYYDEKSNSLTCPQNQVTIRKVRNNVENGFQHYFDAATCKACLIRETCTTNENGRSIFISDHHRLTEEAKAMNETPEGQAALRARNNVERMNNELANHQKMRRPYFKDPSKVRVFAKIKGMAVNIKLIVKKLGYSYKDPFVRQKSRRQRGAS
ncbi:transposase, partial [Paenibacillus sp. GCM10027626]|uniref:transposase n=1 Tax=Paenibacillus sp. GCM10027626 TaxID=3273411 RepID=UPI003627E51C